MPIFESNFMGKLCAAGTMAAAVLIVTTSTVSPAKAIDLGDLLGGNSGGLVGGVVTGANELVNGTLGDVTRQVGTLAGGLLNEPLDGVVSIDGNPDGGVNLETPGRVGIGIGGPNSRASVDLDSTSIGVANRDGSLLSARTAPGPTGDTGPRGAPGREPEMQADGGGDRQCREQRPSVGRGEHAREPGELECAEVQQLAT